MATGRLPREALDILERMGITEEEYLAWIGGKGVGAGQLVDYQLTSKLAVALPEIQATMSEEEFAGILAAAEAAPAYKPPADPTKDEVDAAAMKASQEALERVAAARVAGEEVSDKDIDTITEVTGSAAETMDLIAQAMTSLTQENDVRLGALAWIHGPNGNLIGQLGSIDMTDVGLFALQMHASIVDPEDLMYSGPGSETMSVEERFERGTQEFFMHQNDITTTVINAYGDSKNLRLTEEDRLAYNMSEELDLTYGQAKAVNASAVSAGIDPLLVPTIYKIAEDRGTIIKPWREPDWQAAADAPTIEELLGQLGIVGTPPPGVPFERTASQMQQADPAENVRGGRPRYDRPDRAQWMIGTMWKNYQGFYEEYGSEIVAVVALESEDLARRLSNDPYSLSTEEMTEISDIIGDPEQWSNYSASSATQVAWIQKRLSGIREVVRVDTDGAKEAARTLAASWNMPELSDSLLNNIAAGHTAANLSAIKAAQGNPFRPQLGGPVAMNVPGPYAAAAKALRGTSEYQTLFENMRSGESEEEYASRFDAAVTKFMGDSDPVLARTGMRSGSTMTVGQNALATGEAFENSKFMQRLSLMGSAFKEAT